MAVIYNDNHFYEIFVPKLKEAINYVLENITEENINEVLPYYKEDTNYDYNIKIKDNK